MYSVVFPRLDFDWKVYLCLWLEEGLQPTNLGRNSISTISFLVSV